MKQWSKFSITQMWTKSFHSYEFHVFVNYEHNIPNLFPNQILNIYFWLCLVVYVFSNVLYVMEMCVSKLLSIHWSTYLVIQEWIISFDHSFHYKSNGFEQCLGWPKLRPLHWWRSISGSKIILSHSCNAQWQVGNYFSYHDDIFYCAFFVAKHSYRFVSPNRPYVLIGKL